MLLAAVGSALNSSGLLAPRALCCWHGGHAVLYLVLAALAEAWGGAGGVQRCGWLFCFGPAAEGEEVRACPRVCRSH